MKNRLPLMFMLLLITALTTSCARDATNPQKRAAEMEKPLFNIRGEVLWKGPAAIVYPIATSAYRGACGKRKGLDIVRVISARRWHERLLDVVVWLEPVWEEMDPEGISALGEYRYRHPPEVYTIVERNCEYVPRMTVVPVGSSIELVNEDRKDHWIVFESDDKRRVQYVQLYGDVPPVFTFETPGIHHIPRGQPLVLQAKKTGKWSLESGFHRWMVGWVYITDKIWFAKVNDKGYFELPDVPRGVYEIHTWHPILGENAAVVRVPEETRGLVSVDYVETPERVARVTSTMITTEGEVRETGAVWKEVEDW